MNTNLPLYQTQPTYQTQTVYQTQPTYQTTYQAQPIYQTETVYQTQPTYQTTYQAQPMYQMAESTYVNKPVVLNTQPTMTTSVSSISTTGSTYRHQGELVNSVPRVRTSKPRVSKTKTVVSTQRRPSSFDPFLDKRNQRKFINAGKAVMLGYLTKMIAERIIAANRSGKNKSRKEKKGLIRKLAKTFFVIQTARKLLAYIESEPSLHRHYLATTAQAKSIILQKASDFIVTPKIQALGTGVTVKDKALRLAKGLIVKQINKHLYRNQQTILRTSQVNQIGQIGQISQVSQVSYQDPLTQQTFLQESVTTNRPLDVHISKSTIAKDLLTKNFDKTKAKGLMYDLGVLLMDKAANAVNHTTKY